MVNKLQLHIISTNSPGRQTNRPPPPTTRQGSPVHIQNSFPELMLHTASYHSQKYCRISRSPLVVLCSPLDKSGAVEQPLSSQATDDELQIIIVKTPHQESLSFSHVQCSSAGFVKRSSLRIKLCMQCTGTLCPVKYCKVLFKGDDPQVKYMQIDAQHWSWGQTAL